MAELHPNQIPFRAGRTAKANFVAPEDYLSGPFARIAEIAGKTADTLAAIDDTELSERLNTSAAMGLDEISRYEPSDNNFEPAKQKMMANLKETFEAAPASAQQRFLRQNPTYFESKGLDADKIIFNKRIKYAETKINTLIPQLASNVTTGVTSYDEALKELQNLLKDTSNPFAESKLFEFNKEITVGNINNLINAGRYQDALDIINNPAQSPELSPSDRTNLNNSVQQTQNAVIKEQEALREKLRKQLKDSGTDVENELVKQGLKLQERDDDAYAQFMSALTDGTSIDYKDRKGNVVFSVNAKGIDEITRRDAAKKLRGYEADSIALRRITYNANEKAENLGELVKSQASLGNRGLPSTITDINDYLMSYDSRYLSDANYKKLSDFVDVYNNSKISAVMPSSEFGTETALYEGVYFDPRKSESIKKKWKVLSENAVKDYLVEKYGEDKYEKVLDAGLRLGGAADTIVQVFGAPLRIWQQQQAPSPAAMVALQTISQLSEATDIEIDGKKIHVSEQNIQDARNAVEAYLMKPGVAFNTLMYNFYNNVLSDEQVPNSGTVGDYAYKLWGESLVLKNTAPTTLLMAGIPANVTDKMLTQANNEIIAEITDNGSFDTVLGGSADPKESNKIRNEIAEKYFQKIGALPASELNEKQRAARDSIIGTVGRGNNDGGTSTIVDLISGSGTTDPMRIVEPERTYTTVLGGKWKELTQGNK